jgi:hypothetical protein
LANIAKNTSNIVKMESGTKVIKPRTGKSNLVSRMDPQSYHFVLSAKELWVQNDMVGYRNHISKFSLEDAAFTQKTNASCNKE